MLGLTPLRATRGKTRRGMTSSSRHLLHRNTLCEFRPAAASHARPPGFGHAAGLEPAWV